MSAVAVNAIALPDGPGIRGDIYLINSDLYDFYRTHNRDFGIVAMDKQSNELTRPTEPSTEIRREIKIKFSFVLNFESGQAQQEARFLSWKFLGPGIPQYVLWPFKRPVMNPLFFYGPASDIREQHVVGDVILELTKAKSSSWKDAEKKIEDFKDVIDASCAKSRPIDENAKDRLQRDYCILLRRVLAETPGYREKAVKDSDKEALFEIERKLLLDYIGAANNLKTYRSEYVADALADWVTFASQMYLHSKYLPNTTLSEAKNKISAEEASFLSEDLAIVWKAKLALPLNVLENAKLDGLTKEQKNALRDRTNIWESGFETVKLESFQKLVELFEKALPLPDST